MLALSIKNLKKDYDNKAAVNGLNLDIKEGEFFAFLGPNGAGKTTTIGCITGLVTYNKGSIKVFGKDVVKDYREARSLIGLSPQEPIFDRSLKVQEVLVYQAGFMGIKKQEAIARSEELLKLFNLWEKRKAEWFNLSGGMKRRLSIAKAMMHKPKLLVLDEPTAGLDVELRRDLWKVIEKVNKEGITILLTTHYIEEAQQLADKIAIIDQGKIIKLDQKNNLMDLGMRKLTVEVKEMPSKLSDSLLKLKPEIKGKTIIFTYQKNKNHTDEILKAVLGMKLHIQNVFTDDESLEDIFLKITRKKK